MLVSAFSYGAGAHAINDNFSSQESKALPPLFISADTLFHIYVLSINSSRLIRAFAHILGDENKKNVLKKSDLMNSMSTLFTHLPDNKLNLLVNCASEDQNEEIKIDESEKIYSKNRNVFYKATKQYEIIDEDLEIEKSQDENKRCFALF